MYWNALKAFLRGQFIQIISSIKTETKAWEIFVLQEVKEVESVFIANPTDHTEKRWLEAQALAQQCLTKAENKHFFLQQKFYEEGENTSHMIAMMAISNRGIAFISAVKDTSGMVVHSHSDI